jgi:predicted GNAT family acetyltransferase
MSEIVITREDGASKGRYAARVEGQEGEAELTYSRVNPHLIIADHTGVPDSMRGAGLDWRVRRAS